MSYLVIVFHELIKNKKQKTLSYKVLITTTKTSLKINTPEF